MTAAVPDGWTQQVLATHKISLSAVLQVDGQPVMALPSPLQSGSGGGSAPQVTIDTTANALWAAQLSFADPDNTLRALLAPLGAEIVLTASIDDGTGGVWTVPLCAYGLTGRNAVNTTVSSTIGPVVTVNGQDRSQAFGANKPTQTVNIAAGTPLAVATIDLLTTALPWVPSTAFTLDDGGVTLPAQSLPGDGSVDPWQTCTGWWAQAGLRLHVSRHNIVGSVIGGSTVPLPTPTRTWGPGEGLLGIAGDGADGTASYNGVTVVANSTDGPAAQATAWDDNPSSPTWVGGPFGRRPAPPVTSTTARTVQDCYAAAAALLPSLCGLAQSLTVDVLPDPSVDPWDVVNVTSHVDGIDGVRQVTAINLTLDTSSQMQVTCTPLRDSPPGLSLGSGYDISTYDDTAMFV